MTVKPPLSTEHITSLNPDGSRRDLLVAEVEGFWRTQRTRVQVVLLALFLITPWTSLSGRQTLLINIIDREFSFFGFFLRAHNTPLLFFLIGGGVLTLAGITSIWGRAWCGWACPQTVFIDSVFRKIELLIEGNYLQRMALSKADLTLSKVFKKALKWFLFTIAATLIAHSFMAYFVGSYRFIEIVQNGPAAHQTIFNFVIFFTALFLFDFGWFREQFCTIMCPYGRIQGLLLEKNSLVIEFDQQRKTDCVQCQRCVGVCPVGIDIRNGLQMECIACTACVDACDDIMRKIKKPEKLIQYTTLNHKKLKFTRPRRLAYIAGISICVFGFIFSLLHLKPVELFILRGLETPYRTVVTETGHKKVINHFRLQIVNQAFDEEKYSLNLESKASAQLITSTPEFTVKPKEQKEIHFFIEGPATSEFVNQNILLKVTDSKKIEPFTQTFSLKILGPRDYN